MEPTTTIGAGAILIPAAIIVCTIMAVKVWKSIRPFIGMILVIIAVFQFLGVRFFGVLGMASVGWLLWERTFGPEWYLGPVAAVAAWVLGFLLLVSPRPNPS